MGYILAGVADGDLYAGDELFAVVKTFTETTLSIDVSAEDIRAGRGNKLIGQYFHDSKLELKITDALFQLDYLAKQTGGDIVIGSDTSTIESVVLTTGKAGTVVKGTPVDVDSFGTIGWVSLKGTDNWYKVLFTGKNFTSPIGNVGDTVCVKYFTFDSSAEKLVIPANYVPQTFKVVLKVPVYYSATDTSNIENLTTAGYVEIVVPKFRLNGKTDINMTAGGVSTTSLEGTALAVEEAACDSSSGTYATITQVILKNNWYDDVTGISLADDSIELDATDTTANLEVWAMSNKGNYYKVPAANFTDFTFTSTVPATATVSSTGVITRVAAGDSIIKVVLTAKNLSTQADVIVS